MDDKDPRHEYQRRHELRRAVAYGILTFYGLTIVLAIVSAALEK